ncbi:hypothetical protein COT72_01140 [archaeon CG10_big_fil_rev_8_21_14_0_10_43_11]|nr:MAG: hypothetical protein COT72_01140 [archaeon CG10_big_fil_rev_8_21_14_0_10_43_11]
MVFDSIVQFVYHYFWRPYEQNLGYNYVNTFTYGIILIGLLILGDKVLKRFNITFTRKMAFSLIPFILFGSTVRVLRDAEILPRTFFLVTPSIYLVIGAIIIGCFFISQKTRNPEKSLFIMGSVLWLLALFGFELRNPLSLLYILGLFSGILCGLFVLRKLTGFLRNWLDFAALSAHFLDATATFITLDVFAYLGYWEQHPLTRLIGGLGGSYVWFYVAKLYVLVVIYVINKDVKDEGFKNLLKFAILTLGLAPGVRDLLRLAMLV